MRATHLDPRNLAFDEYGRVISEKLDSSERGVTKVSVKEITPTGENLIACNNC